MCLRFLRRGEWPAPPATIFDVEIPQIVLHIRGGLNCLALDLQANQTPDGRLSDEKT